MTIRQNEPGVGVRVGAFIRLPKAVFDDLGSASELTARATVTVRERKRQRFGGPLTWIETLRPLWRIDGDDLVLPRGMTRAVRDVVGAARWVDETVRAPHEFQPLIPFRPQQTEIAETVAAKVQGIVLAATGSGKTGAACATIAKVGQRTLVLVPTVALAQQWAREVRRFLGVEADVCTGGTWSDDAPVVIATPATAAVHVERLGGFGLLIVDEVQNFATELRCELLGQIPARYRLGLTGTLPRDHRGAILRAVFGPVVYQFGVTDGIASGALVFPRYEQVRTAFRAPYESADDWPSLLDALVADEGRNRQIVDLVTRECRDICALVLSQRLGHLDVLRGMLIDRGLRVAVLTGETPRHERETILAAARAGELDVLLGSTVADEGIDIPGLGALILAFPSKAEGRLMQRIGRVVRAVPGKGQPRVYDLVDDVGPLRRQADHRRRAFVQAFHQQVAA